MENKNILYAAVAILAVVFFAIVAGIFLVQKNNISPTKTAIKEKTAESVPADKTETAKVAEIKETANTSDWRIYENKKFEYETKYPTDLTLWIPTEKKFISGDILQKLYLRKDDDSFIDLTVLPENYDVYADDLEKNLPYKDLMVNGQKAVRLDYKSNDFYTSTTTIYGDKYVYEIFYQEKENGNLRKAYDDLVSTFRLGDFVTPNEINYWELVSGNPTDTCSGPTYQGEATVHGWYEWDYVYVEKNWTLVITKEDAKKLPIKEILGGTVYYDEIMKDPTFVLADAPVKLQEQLKQASPENPIELKLHGFKMYCEGAPTVSLNPMK
ncbi:MAG: hypothetical protein WCV59_04725 [Parcubacteria group bacterium]|jgi:hypothetical protein